MHKLLLYLLITALLLGGCACAADPVTGAAKQLGLDLSSGSVLERSDDHDGFLGDGLTFLRIYLADSPEVAAQIATRWNTLPLTENLMAAAYGLSTDSFSQMSLLRDNNGGPLIPEIENGFYFFLDRQGDTDDDSALFTRASFNFTLAIYDADTHILYYAELDT